MKKYEKADWKLVLLCIGLFCTLACGILMLCFWANGTLMLVFGSCTAAFSLLYAVVACICAAKKQAKHYLELSAEVVVVSTVLIGLSPVALLAYIVESICEKISQKHQKAN